MSELAAGHDIDYEGASGSVNIDSLGDPLSGYVVWAVNSATGKAFNKEIFPESLVVSLLPSPPMMAPLLTQENTPFVVGLIARPEM